MTLCSYESDGSVKSVESKIGFSEGGSWLGNFVVIGGMRVVGHDVIGTVCI